MLEPPAPRPPRPRRADGQHDNPQRPVELRYNPVYVARALDPSDRARAELARAMDWLKLLF